MSVIDVMVGKKVSAVYMSEDVLRFDTDQGPIVFSVEGDCCSHSYFYDFYGMRKLLENGPIVSAGEIELESFEADWETTQPYGFELVTEHPVWGEQTSVFSFRNDSNGYYGGWMEQSTGKHGEIPKLTDDLVSTQGL